VVMITIFAVICTNNRKLSTSLLVRFHKVVQLLNMNLMTASPIPDTVIKYFNLPNSSIRYLAIMSTWPLSELSTRKVS
jgi:hypothetical protein